MAGVAWEFVMLHHSLTKDSGTVSWRAIRRFHVAKPPAGQGWLDIGYHFGVEMVADPDPSLPGGYEVLVGRTMDRVGAHCYQDAMNSRAVGVCLVGNFDAAPPPAEQLEAAAKLVRWLLASLGLGPAAVILHRDLATYKTCPGSAFPVEKFRSML